MTLCAALTACGPGGKAKETEESGTGRTEEGQQSPEWDREQRSTGEWGGWRPGSGQRGAGRADKGPDIPGQPDSAGRCDLCFLRT